MERVIATELEDYIGKTGTMAVRCGEGRHEKDKGPVFLHFPVEVVDAKRAFGMLRFRVKPRDRRALGRSWVSAARIKLDETGGQS